MYTPYYIGEVEVMCIGDPKDPDPNWIPQLAQAAVTRAQTKHNKNDIKPLKVVII